MFSVAMGLVTPPTLAVTSAVPTETPVAVPVLSIVATPEKLTDQFKTAFAIVLPFTSVAVATKCCCWPTLIVALIGEIDTEATSGNTVRLTGGLVTVLTVAVAVI
jgi:hypothetical protein